MDDCDAKDFVFRSGGDIRSNHLSPGRRELALSLVLHKVAERHACHLLCKIAACLFERITVVKSGDSLSFGEKDIHQAGRE